MAIDVIKNIKKISDKVIRLQTTITNIKEEDLTIADLISKKESIENAILRTQEKSNETISALTKQLQEVNSQISEARSIGVIEDNVEPSDKEK